MRAICFIRLDEMKANSAPVMMKRVSTPATARLVNAAWNSNCRSPPLRIPRRITSAAIFRTKSTVSPSYVWTRTLGKGATIFEMILERSSGSSSAVLSGFAPTASTSYSH